MRARRGGNGIVEAVRGTDPMGRLRESGTMDYELED